MQIRAKSELMSYSDYRRHDSVDFIVGDVRFGGGGEASVLLFLIIIRFCTINIIQINLNCFPIRILQWSM